jgi:CheY-like chemotaxis protein
MLDSEETRWMKSTANELNNLLQVISEASQMIETLCEGTSDTDKYFAMLRSAVERSAKVTQLMVDRAAGLPVILAAPAASERKAPLPADVRIFNPNGPLELILLVDDEDFVTMLAQRVLADAGYRVVTAGDGFQALELYRKLSGEVDLVILDFTMPVMDGADVFNELLQLDPKAPVVLSSGFAEQERLRGMLARGLRGFIPKPYTQEKLLAQIRSTLDALKAEKTGERRVL